jgi:hypothetical protein
VDNNTDCDDTDNTITTGTTFYADTDNSITTGINPGKEWNNKIGNYPYPFDQMTFIVYDLSAGSYIDLVIFDQKGRMIDILVREDHIAGHYSIEYDGSKLDGGIYTLRLATDKGVYTSRMVVR